MDALVVQVGMARTASFRTESEAARQDVDRLTGAVKTTSAELAVMQREARAAGDAVDAGLTAKIKATRSELKGLQSDLRTSQKDFKILSEATPAPPPMPKASMPSAVVKVAQVAEETAGAGISRMGGMELGHVARSLAGSVMAGMPIGRSLEMESPRLISALGPAAMSAVGGLGGLAAVLGPLIAAVAVAGTGFAIFNNNREARKQIDSNDLLGNVFNRHGDTVEGLNRDLEVAEKAERDTRHKRHSKLNNLANGLGVGVLDDGKVEDVAARKRGIRDRRDDAMERDAGFARRAFEGDDGVEQAKLKVQLEDKIRQIRESGVKDGNRLVAIAREEHQVSSDILARKQKGQALEVAIEQELLSIRKAGINVEVESANARVRAAQKALKNGPASGHEHDELKNRESAALVDQSQAKRNQDAHSAAISAEERIVAIKRAGLDVDIKIAQERLKSAQAALDRNPARTGVEYDALKAAVSASRLEVDAATKATGEKKAQLALETQIANLRGSSDQVRRQTLALEAAHLRDLIHSTATTPDERRGHERSLRQNRQQQDEVGKADRLRAIDTAETEDRAHAGRGFEDQIRLLGMELFRNEQRRAWNKDENGGNPEMAANLDEKFKDLAQTLSDVIFAERQRLQSLRTEDAQIRERGLEPTLEMKNRNVDARYQSQIDEERHGRNDPAVIEQLQRNRVDEHFQNAVDEEQMTPAQRRQRQHQNERRAQAAARVAERERRHAEVETANHPERSFDDYFRGPDRHTIGGHAQPNRRLGAEQPNRRVSAADAVHKAAADAGFKGSLGTVESLLSAIKENCTFKGK